MALKPWREVITPHPDVASGRYQQAEFAADLAQVLQGTAEPEYQDATEFFARTYLTEGIRRLLVESVERLSGKGGEPVVQLKTAFGGGKTHTMLALFHLLSGKARADQMAGASDILREAQVSDLPSARLAVIVYARNIYGVHDLPAGSFDSNMTFVQSLTEAAKRSKRSLVVASIPASDIEVGGEGGKAALERIENTFGRLEAIWKPVGAMEGFEIVRRRLFTPVKDEAARDDVCRELIRLYDENPTDFPRECREGTYLDRLRAAYPIHPELFDRLYEDWSSLERFQRTRGVLRLMAAVIHDLWMRDDRSLLILPGSMTLDAPRVRNELMRYLPEGWSAIVDKDVDGEHAEPRAIDESSPRFGTVSAARRVARTIFLGSAPSVRQQTVRGIEDVRVRLGVTQPGESVAVFNDALSRLVDRLTHLYSGNRRYWYDTQPNLRRTMEDRAGKLDAAEVKAEIVRRLRLIRERGDFKAVYVCPASGDVPDEQEARLVILSSSSGHRASRFDSAALAAATEVLDKRGNSPRTHRNMLLFVAADAEQVNALEQETRRFLAWKSIIGDADALNLDAHQRREAVQGEERSNETVSTQLNEAYCWLLVPTQEGTDAMKWEATRIAGGQENPVAKAAKKVRTNEQLIIRWSPALLRMELDRWLWKEAPHVSLKRVWECLTTYLYLPRLRDEDVLIATIREGIRSRDYFGYASSIGAEGRYEGLQFGSGSGSIYLDASSVLVKPDVAAKQQEAEATIRSTPGSTGYPTGAAGTGADVAVRNSTATATATTAGMPAVPRPNRFHGSVRLDPTRLARDAGQIAEEVVQHLASLVGAYLEITLEIHATIPDGAPDNVVRTVTENCRTLRFTSYGFEAE